MIVATIIVVAILTLLIFTLTIIALHSLLKAEKKEISSGSKDDEIVKNELENSKASSKTINIISNIICGTIALFMVLAAGTACVYRASNGQISIGDTTSLVIVSDSMSKFYNDEYEVELITEKEDAEKDQFDIGDLVQFKKVNADDELKLFDVYGYKAKNGKTITHRYIGQTDDGLYIFRGDNTGGRDSYVSREQIVLHYNNVKIQRVGYFILFTQSGFGLYALISVIGVYVIAEIYIFIYNKLVKDRLNVIKAIEDTKNEPELVSAVEEKPAELLKPKKSNIKLVHFTTYDGRHVKFYMKGKK